LRKPVSMDYFSKTTQKNNSIYKMSVGRVKRLIFGLQ